MAGLTEFYCGWNEPSHASQFKWLEYTFKGGLSLYFIQFFLQMMWISWLVRMIPTLFRSLQYYRWWWTTKQAFLLPMPLTWRFFYRVPVPAKIATSVVKRLVLFSFINLQSVFRWTSRSGSGSFHQQAKRIMKNLDFYSLELLHNFIFEEWCKCTT